MIPTIVEMPELPPGHMIAYFGGRNTGVVEVVGWAGEIENFPNDSRRQYFTRILVNREDMLKIQQIYGGE